MSDHISGPRALAQPIADITDFYAFPSPERPGHLVLVQDTLPFAPPTASFSNGLIHRFRLRPLISGPKDGPPPFALGADESTFDFEFSAADAGTDPSRRATCKLPTGEAIDLVFGDDRSASTPGLRVFAGPRWDPFFMDAPAMLETISTGRLSFSRPGAIYLDGKNVLSLVIEIDCALLLGGAGLFAAVTETLTKGIFPVRLERVGRPEVKNMLLGPKQFDRVNRDLEIRDLYNMEDAFHLEEAYQGAYRARLDANLAFWDSLDGTTDWPAGTAGTPDTPDGHPLRELFLADHLVVDATKPYSEQGSFLEIERAGRERRRHETGGGRALNDDVMDAMFTLLINADRGPTISDGVDRATRTASSTFPYLAPPNPDPPQPPEHH